MGLVLGLGLGLGAECIPARCEARPPIALAAPPPAATSHAAARHALARPPVAPGGCMGYRPAAAACCAARDSARPAGIAAPDAPLAEPGTAPPGRGVAHAAERGVATASFLRTRITAKSAKSTRPSPSRSTAAYLLNGVCVCACAYAWCACYVPCKADTRGVAE